MPTPRKLDSKRAPKRLCTFSLGCNRPAHANDLCEAHNRQKARQTPLRPLGHRDGKWVHVDTRITPEANEKLKKLAESMGVSPYSLLSDLITKAVSHIK